MTLDNKVVVFESKLQPGRIKMAWKGEDTRHVTSYFADSKPQKVTGTTDDYIFLFKVFEASTYPKRGSPEEIDVIKLKGKNLEEGQRNSYRMVHYLMMEFAEVISETFGYEVVDRQAVI